jgi:hypothetical protein
MEEVFSQLENSYMDLENTVSNLWEDSSKKSNGVYRCRRQREPSKYDLREALFNRLGWKFYGMSVKIHF